MQCPNCNHPNRPTASFCAGCGQSLSSAQQADTGSQATCVNCGQPLRANAQFCGHCGARQQAAPSPPPPARDHSAPAPVQQPAPSTASRPSTAYILRHTFFIGVLGLSLLLALAGAFVTARSSPSSTAPAPPAVPTPAAPAPAPVPTADYRQAVVEIGYTNSGRFGLRSTEGDPATRSDNNKLLTYDDQGATHNTRVWIDGETPIYGGSWLFGLFDGGRFLEEPHLEQGEVRSVWAAKDVEVTQTLSYVYGSSTERVDTIQIRYDLTNVGRSTRDVGLRIMLDTLIGDNDGVPFVVPGREGITDRAVDLRDSDVPNFIQALEFPNLAEPGVIVNLTLRGADATPPDRLVISAWCDGDAKWDYYRGLGGDGHPLRRCGGRTNTPDSAIGLYFSPQPLPPGQTRTITTYYGLGSISSTESGNVSLSLTFSRTVRQDDVFWVTALVTAPQAGQTVRLNLPNGLAFVDGYGPEQTVTAGDDYTQVSWRVVATAPIRDGPITATLQPDGVTESQSITVQAKGITR